MSFEKIQARFHYYSSFRNCPYIYIWLAHNKVTRDIYKKPENEMLLILEWHRLDQTLLTPPTSKFTSNALVIDTEILPDLFKKPNFLLTLSRNGVCCGHLGNPSLTFCTWAYFAWIDNWVTPTCHTYGLTYISSCCHQHILKLHLYCKWDLNKNIPCSVSLMSSEHLIL